LGNLEKQDTTRLELALEMIKKSVGFDAQLVKDSPAMCFGAAICQRLLFGGGYLKESETTCGRAHVPSKLVETRRLLAYQLGPPEAARIAEAAKMLGDRSQGLAQDEAYRLATRIWQRIVERFRSKGASSHRSI